MESFAYSSHEKPVLASQHISYQYLGTLSDGHLLTHAIAPPTCEGASLAALAQSAQQISPMLQLIMRLPGQIGLFSSFFEALKNFIAPHVDFVSQFDPSCFGFHHPPSTGGESLGEHISFDSALLPTHGNVLENWQAQSFHINTHFQEDGFTYSPEAVSATPVLTGPTVSAHSGLETASAPSGQLAGPNLDSSLTPAPHLANSHPVFSDRLLERSNAGFSNSSLPVSQPVSTSLGQGQSSISVSNNASGGLGASGAVSNELGAKHLLDADGNEISPAKFDSAGQILSKTGLDKAAAADNSVGLKANELTLGHPSQEIKVANNWHAKSHHFAQHAHNKSHLNINEKHNQSTSSDSASATNQDSIASQSDSSTMPKSDKVIPVAYTQDVVQAGQPLVANAAGQAQAVPSTYTIVSGDCLWNIAKNHLGNALRWQDIYKLNGDKLGSNPDLIYPGTQIDLPSVDHAQIAAAGATAPSPYVVHSGDNLWDIAKSHLGNGTRWSEIYKLNTDIIGNNPRLILPGQELKLPSMNVGDQSATLANAAPIPSAAPVQSMPSDQVLSSAPSTDAVSQSVAVSNAAPADVAAAPVVPSHSQILSGPGGAQAANITQNQSSPSVGVVSSSLAPDLSFLGKRR